MKTNYRRFAVTVLLMSVLTNVFAGWQQDSLSGNRNGMIGVQVGPKAVFVNGGFWDIYDFTAGSWSTGTLTQGRNDVLAAGFGDKAYFAGGWIGPFTDPVSVNTVNIYNSSTNTWNATAAKLSVARRVGGATGINGKLIFAGGRQVLNYSTRVDIFDAATGARTTASLSQARTAISVGRAGTKAVFAGGETGNITMGTVSSSNKIDIYDAAANTWSTATLSSRRQGMAVAEIGSKIIFAGGINMGSGLISKTVDIYDAATNTWTVTQLSETKYGIGVAVANGKAYFAGGVVNGGGTLSNRVEVYDLASNTWSYVTISSPRMSMVSGVTPSRIMFAGGVTTWGNTGTDRVEVLNLTTNTWSVEYLSQPRLAVAAASFGTRTIFAGGNQFTSSYPIYTIPSKRVDIWDDSFPVAQQSGARTSATADEALQVHLFPNPAATTVHLHFQHTTTAEVTVRLYNAIGVLLSETTVDASSDAEIPVSEFVNGVYLLNVSEGGNRGITQRFVVKQ